MLLLFQRQRKESRSSYACEDWADDESRPSVDDGFFGTVRSCRRSGAQCQYVRLPLCWPIILCEDENPHLKLVDGPFSGPHVMLHAGCGCETTENLTLTTKKKK